MNGVRRDNCEARRVRPWRARWAPCLLAAALAIPGAAHPYSLDALLRMPLEHLLQLQATPRRLVRVDGATAPVARAWQADERQRHEV